MALEQVSKKIESSVGVTDPRFLHWGSVFSGVLITMGLGLVLLVFGNAIGFNLTNTYSDAVGGGLKAISWIYMLVAMVISNFVGGYISGKGTQFSIQSSGAFHGLVTWAFTNAAVFSAGALFTAAGRALLAGVATNSFNWLSVIGLVISCAGAMVGGILAGRLQGQIPVTTEYETRSAA